MMRKQLLTILSDQRSASPVSSRREREMNFHPLQNSFHKMDALHRACDIPLASLSQLT